jgi:hypothetical protein
MSPKAPGNSGVPLVRKLGIIEGSAVVLRRAPAGYFDWLGPLPLGVQFLEDISIRVDIVHLFCDTRSVLKAELESLRGSIRSDAAIWVSWPKRSSGAPTDISDDAIRELAIPLGFVDVKVCAVSEVWSALKLVIRKELRKS